MTKVKTKKQLQLDKQNPKKEGHSLKEFMDFFGLALAVITFILFFWPRISIEIIGPTDPMNSFSITSTITNNGYLPFRDVRVGFGWGKVIVVGKQQDLKILESFIKEHPDTEVPFVQNLNLGGGFFGPDWSLGRLGLDEKFSVPIGQKLSTVASNKIGYANVAIVVFYKLWIFPIEFKKVQRFITRARSDGLIDWNYQPSNPSQKYNSP